MRLLAICAAILAGTLLASVPLRSQDIPANMDFESGTAGSPPRGWAVEARPSGAAISAITDTSNPQAGRASATLTVTGDHAGGDLTRSIDATPYRGGIVLLQAAARGPANTGSTAALWLRADGMLGQMYPAVSTSVRSPQWKIFHLVLSVPADAQRIVLGLTQTGPGKSGLDSVSLETVDPAKVGWEAPHALTPRGLANLRAFARLFGYVRFFHPSDQSAAANWNAVAILGVQRVEGAPDTRTLVSALRDIFMPLAPTLRIFATGGPVPAALPVIEPCATTIGWVHHGVHVGADYPGAEGYYRSERVAVTSPRPDEAFAADLGAGVSILMPTTLCKDAEGKLPHGSAGAIRPDKPVWFEPSGNDRATRLAGIVLSWTVFQHFYPYFVEEPVDWDRVLSQSLAEAAADSGETAFAATLEREVAALRDGHGYVTFTRQKILMLPLVWKSIEDRVVVTRAAPGAGSLQPGDVIDRIDGRPMTAVMAEMYPRIAAATPHAKTSKLLWALLRRTSRAPVMIEAHRAHGERVTASVVPGGAVDDIDNDTLKPVSELRPGLWYVDLRRVQQSDFAAAVGQLVQAKRIIFDDRGYPTPFAVQAMAHLFDKPIPSVRMEVPVTTLPDRKVADFAQTGGTFSPLAPAFGGKFVFMTDAQAISYGEMLMDMVEDNHLGTIVGSTTAGTDGTIDMIALPGGYSISFTGTHVLKADGSRFHGVGVVPTVPVRPTIDGVRAGRDEVLEKAIAVATAANSQ